MEDKLKLRIEYRLSPLVSHISSRHTSHVQCIELSKEDLLNYVNKEGIINVLNVVGSELKKKEIYFTIIENKKEIKKQLEEFIVTKKLEDFI